MFFATSRQPPPKAWSFVSTRFKSLTEAEGFRFPIELTQRIRFCRANRSMMCFLLRGSPSQSLLKQMMLWPSIIKWTSFCKCAGLAIDKQPVPDFENQERPDFLPSVLPALLMLADDVFNDAGIHVVSTRRVARQERVVNELL